MKHCFLCIVIIVSFLYSDILKLYETRQFPVKLLSSKASITNNNVSYLKFKTKLKPEVKIPKGRIEFLEIGGQRYDFVSGRPFTDTNTIPPSIFEISSSDYIKGVYRNYTEFYFNSPTFPMDSVEISKASPNGVVSDEYILVKIKKRKKFVEKKHMYKSDFWGYCDGQNLYIKGPRYLSKLHLDAVGVWFWNLYPFLHFVNPQTEYTLTLDKDLKIKKKQVANEKWSWSDDSTYWEKKPCLLSVDEGTVKVTTISVEVFSSLLHKYNKLHYFLTLPVSRQKISLNRFFSEFVVAQENSDLGNGGDDE